MHLYVYMCMAAAPARGVVRVGSSGVSWRRWSTAAGLRRRRSRWARRRWRRPSLAACRGAWGKTQRCVRVAMGVGKAWCIRGDEVATGHTKCSKATPSVGGCGEEGASPPKQAGVCFACGCQWLGGCVLAAVRRTSGVNRAPAASAGCCTFICFTLIWGCGWDGRVACNCALHVLHAWLSD